MARSKNDAALLEGTDTAGRTAVAGALALAHFDKHTSTVRCAHDQINLAATSTRGSIIALQQQQPGALQMLQRQRFTRISRLFGGAGFELHFCRKKTHVEHAPRFAHH